MINSILSTKGAKFATFDLKDFHLNTPQAGKISNNQLIEYLKPHGYIECPITPGLWKHKTRDIQSCLVVNDFGIKYTKEEDILHLKTILEKI